MLLTVFYMLTVRLASSPHTTVMGQFLNLKITNRRNNMKKFKLLPLLLLPLLSAQANAETEEERRARLASHSQTPGRQVYVTHS
jgi:hypothetical protein